MKIHNPIAFTPTPVTVITSLVYIALLAALLVVHTVVPSAPKSSTPISGVNLTEAWLDLRILTEAYRPYNSRQNDHIRDWLLRRIETIIAENNAAPPTTSDPSSDLASTSSADSPAVVFSDITSNLTFSSEREKPGAGISIYFEGTNIIVYIRGSEDEKGEWWTKKSIPQGKGGVLVNAHYDSVSTGYGATDDGVGVISILQLIKHFTSTGKQPKKGIVALLNNGEEDFLNGARAFTQHPMSQFAHTFLNLEGAGAGGRAALFRSTDTEVTKAYQTVRYPFGDCASGDAFSRGVIRSETDYVIFNGLLGLRGLDVAFTEPRARYHTDEDDTKHTSVDSLWHMLSAALATVQALTSDTSSQFDGEPSGRGKVPSGKGTTGVWFSFFGEKFAVFRLHTLFALSVTLLVVAPLVLIVLAIILTRVDKNYLFSSSKHHHHPEGDDTVPLKGLRGIARYPLIFVSATAAVIALAFMLESLNPYIVYSSPYAVWSMMLSAWLFVAWAVTRSADWLRPTALHRAYALLWMFAAGWVVLIVITVFEQKTKIAGDYFMIFYFAAIAVATSISFFELFGLQNKSQYADDFATHDFSTAVDSRPRSASSSRILDPEPDETLEDAPERPAGNEGEEDADETTSLLRKGRQSTFARRTSPHSHRENQDPVKKKRNRVYGFEQDWSWSLPSWTWLLQFLIVAPIPVILVGQVGLLFMSGIHQTLGDGNDVLPVYLGAAVFSILILAPLGPFLHRYTFHIPTFLFLIFAGTLIYNVIAFPFSGNNRLKLYFMQNVDLDTGISRVSLTGVGDPYMSETIASLPSSAGQEPSCVPSILRKGLTECSWNGLAPAVVKSPHPDIPPLYNYADWLTYHVFRAPNSTEARIRLWGRNTRACKIQFNRPISDFHVDGAGDDKRFKRVSEDGSKEIRLWSRTWEKEWTVHVKWEIGEDGARGMDGRVVCLWSDDNETGTIPALDEVRHFAPEWVAIAKLGDGLVEGSKAFLV
ncbi:vacuolar membrane protease [Physcia stellaris]|nr:vacuolar membrane protease [Physcia stellaris]